MRRMLRPAVTALVALGILLTGAASAPAATITSSAKLLPSDAPGSARYGMSVALSSDGTIALVGASYAAPSGKAYVLVKSGGVWSETAILTSSDGGVNSDNFGNAVALSADGTTAFVGAPGATVGTATRAGAVYVFTRASTTAPFVQQAKLTAATPSASAEVGSSVATSADGSQLVTGAAAEGADYRGGAYFFARDTAGTWSAGGSVSGSSESALMGTSVAMSADGATAAVGQPYYKYLVSGKTTYQPMVTTFTRSGAYWSYSKTISTPTGASTSSNRFGGGALSFTANGQQLLVGAPGTGYVGTTPVTGIGYLFAWTGSAWGTPKSFTAAATGSGGHQMGGTGAIAADGSSVLLGGVDGNAYSTSSYGGGAVWKWNRTTSGTWPTTPNDVFHGFDITTGDRFSQSLAIGADPAHPLVGASGKSSFAGAAYAF